MFDTYAKYFRLLAMIFFMAAGFILLIVLGFSLLRLAFSALDHLSWTSFIYMSVMLMLPSIFFITVYVIYFKRSLRHPSKPIRFISYSIFLAGILTWLISLVLDLMLFFPHGYTEIGKYHSFNLLFLMSNVGAIFLVGIMQALAMPEEKDWLQKNKA